ncbi:hypothetical protein C8R44DRAFT_867841 [Mycena epipterygia]|nr:hypothetical protein C8R44DRAFT_867841 [Mycena epipterygia]
MSFKAHSLQDPTDFQIEQLIQLCARAYDPADISVKNLVGGDISLLDAFFGASIRAGALGAQIYVATETGDSNVIRGMAMWWGPGVEPFSTSVSTNLPVERRTLTHMALQRRTATKTV